MDSTTMLREKETDRSAQLVTFICDIFMAILKLCQICVWIFTVVCYFVFSLCFACLKYIVEFLRSPKPQVSSGIRSCEEYLGGKPRRVLVQQNLSKTVVVPSRLYHQPEHMDLLNKFLNSISYREDRVKEVRDGDDFKNPKPQEVVLLPCIMASRAGSDFGAMFQNLGLDKAHEYPHLNIVVFTPKAEFVTASVLTSQERMGDEFKVGRMFDVYFYGEDIYKCETNTEAKKRVTDLLK